MWSMFAIVICLPYGHVCIRALVRLGTDLHERVESNGLSVQTVTPFEIDLTAVERYLVGHLLRG